MTNKKRRKEIIRNLLLWVSIAAVLISGAWFTQTNIRVDELKSVNTDLKATLKTIKKEQQKDKGGKTTAEALKVYKGNDIERLEKQVDKLKLRYQAKSTDMNVINDIVKNYVNGRYNFSGSPKNNVKNIIAKVKVYINDDMENALKESLSTSSAGNMGASDSFQHTAKVTDIFYTNIEIPELSGNDNKIDFDNLPYYITAVAKVNMNNSYTAYIRYDLSYIENEWLIISETPLTDDIQISKD